MLAKLRKDTILLFLPTQKSHWGKDRGRSRARGHAECPCREEEGGSKSQLRRGVPVPPSGASPFPGSAGHPRHSRCHLGAAAGCCGDQTCGVIDTASFRRNRSIKLIFKASKN